MISSMWKKDNKILIQNTTSVPDKIGVCDECGQDIFRFITHHCPTNVGTTPHVIFKSVKDDNYYPNMTIANNSADPLDIEYLSGRHFDETHPFGLTVKAYYDLDDGSVTVENSDTHDGVYSPGGWFTKTVNNSYYTELVQNNCKLRLRH